MFHNLWVKNVLSALAVVFFGFILLNLTFLLDFLFQSLVDGAVRLFTPEDVNMAWRWFPPAKHLMFVVIIGLISWFILRSKLGTLYKAIYLTVPLAVILVSVGIFLYSWPVVPYLVGGFITIGILYYLYRTRQPWLYYYTVVLVALTLMIFTLLGGEI